jgi:hypothetical protein
MERFVHNANIEHYRRMIAESEFDPSRDEDRHKMLLTLFAEEVGQGQEAAQLVWLPPHGPPPLMRSAGSGYPQLQGPSVFSTNAVSDLNEARANS